MNENNIERIVKYSKLLKYLTVTMALIYAAINFLFWIFINKIPFFIILLNMPVKDVERVTYPLKVQIIGIIESFHNSQNWTGWQWILYRFVFAHKAIYSFENARCMGH